MLKNLPYLFSLSILLLSGLLTAQEYQQITVGAGYTQQSYVSLQSATEHRVANDAWDIAFSVQGQTDGGIFINESAGSSMGIPQSAIELFDAKTTDFSATPEPDSLLDYQLYNTEQNWQYGAFNENRDPANPFDYGWGAYDPQTHQLAGSAVYVIKLRDGSYLKFQMIALSGNSYAFKYANLDGSNEVTSQVNKADFAGQTLAYYSFATGGTVADIEPEGGYDLFYGRYVAPAYDAENDIYIPYSVTGILQAEGVEVAQAAGIDPYAIDLDTYQDSLQAELDVIGHDWKAYSFTEGWLIALDRAYFVKTADERVWKLIFVDFEGSTSGVTTFEKEDLGIISSVQSPLAIDLQVLTYPNPAQSHANLMLSSPAALDGTTARLVVVNVQGQQIYQQDLSLRSGLQNWIIEVQTWPAGTYFLQLQTSKGPVQLGRLSKQ